MMSSLLNGHINSASLHDHSTDNYQQHRVVPNWQASQATAQSGQDDVPHSGPSVARSRRPIPISQTVAYSWLSVQAIMDFIHKKANLKERIRAHLTKKDTATGHREGSCADYFTFQPQPHENDNTINKRQTPNSSDTDTSNTPRIVLTRIVDNDATRTNNEVYEEIEFLPEDSPFVAGEAKHRCDV